MTWCSQIEEHYRSVWQGEPRICEFSVGPIHDLPDDFRVLKFPPRESRSMWTYATRCMSAPDDMKPIELHIFSPYETEEVVELLVVTAHFHRTSSKLDMGHTVNFGQPWIDRSRCQFGLVSLPYLDGPRLEILSIGSQTVNFYWLIPVTESEVEYKKRHGLEALETEFDKSGLDYGNPTRPAVV